MKKYTLYIGLNDQHTRRQEIPTEKAVEIIAGIFYSMTDGATISQGRGIYTHDDGQKVSEKTIISEIFGGDLDAIKAAAQAIKTALNQEAIALQVEEVNSCFI